MNKRIYYLFILFFVEMLLASCEDKQAKPPIVYPNNTVIVVVNGGVTDAYTHVYTPQHVKFSGDTLSIYAALITGGGNACDGGTIALGMEVYARRAGIYTLNNYNQAFTAEFGFCSPNSFAYYTDSIHTGSINITLLDTIRHIVSGTFNFTAEMQQPMRNGGTETISKGIINNVTW